MTATDQAGNTGSASTTFTVAVDLAPCNDHLAAQRRVLNSTSASVVFTATNSPTSTTCKLDAAAAAACTSPQAYTGLSQGTHTVSVAATNAGGTGSASVSFTVDIVAPTVVISAPANGSTTGSSVTTTFTATDATTTVTGTTCKLDAAAATSCVSGQAYSGLAAGAHTIVVTATDQAGNVGSSTTTFTVAGGSERRDHVAGQRCDSELDKRRRSCSRSRAEPPTSATCKVDAAAAAACTSPFATSGLSQGAHTVVVAATNASGTVTATVNFTVDTIAPAVSISSPANGSTPGTRVTTVFTATDATSSITGSTCKLDAAAATACTSPQAYSGLASGSHTITVTATDPAGNTGSASTTFTVAAIPVVTITLAERREHPRTRPALSVAFTATQLADQHTCKLDAAAAAACTSPLAYTGLGQGSHTVVVTATNAAGSGTHRSPSRLTRSHRS